MSQIALPLATGGGGPVRIVVGKSNARAVEALANPASWPFHAALLVGPEGSGKSLLAGWFSAEGRGDVLDDAPAIPEADIFHAWNRAQEGGRALLLTARPGWQIALPDLASRLAGSLQLEIHAPDDAMIADLLAAHAERRGLALGDAAFSYLTPRIERSHAAAEAVVAAIDRISLERQAPPTMSIWRDALEAVQGPEQRRLL
ncbi:ATPase [Qipengyuania sp.]|uniref:HdaA/DnaA family protein n=1 Tax=Qipengyuania sp. TaxID=2004515 RepID=UPI0035C7F42C